MSLSQSSLSPNQPVSLPPSTVRTRSVILTSMLFLVLILGAFIIRWLTFERYLPYLDYGDEGVPFVIALNWRGLENNAYVAQRYAGYPPAYVLVNMGVQRLGELFAPRPWVLPTEHIYNLRLLAVVVGVVTTLVIANIGWQLAGPSAGWLAGFVWAFAPIIVEHNSLALPDPFVYLTCAVAVAAALRACIKKSPWWLTVSLISGILAIYFKLWPIHALVPWGLVA
ncbi:MAG TPA: glycosyltransferase family 39 protein, partial [Phototrophicaceae bacterium]|nr:glycosyltransferase family 39 protein [Phototrophicaceae bacterium]